MLVILISGLHAGGAHDRAALLGQDWAWGRAGIVPSITIAVLKETIDMRPHGPIVSP